ncbi:MAG: hypothetical protein IJH55_09370 [Romboutsia sp.]|nr:hypothetical protein [Romboutsia sp.]
MSRYTDTETLYCRQEVCNEWLDKDPMLANYITERMNEEIGKALADKINDGKTYKVIMEKPQTEIGYAINENHSAFKSKVAISPIVMCKECKYHFYDKLNDSKMCKIHSYGEVWEDNDFCSWGESDE